MLGHYLMFNGNCEEALAAYKKAFSGEITELERYGDMTPNPAFPITDKQKSLILHGKLKIGSEEIMCADAFEPVSTGNNLYVSFTTSNAASIRKAWDVLKEDAVIYMELTPTFFASAHSSLRDKYGVNWMFTNK